MTGAPVFTICAAAASSNLVAVTCITLAMIFGSLCAGLFRALASVIVSAGTITNFGGYLGGALVPMIPGFIVQATGSFTPALVLEQFRPDWKRLADKIARENKEPERSDRLRSA